MGHTVRVVFPSEYPDNVSWMAGAEEIIIFDIDPERSEEVLITADLVFCKGRSGPMSAVGRL